MNCVWAGAMRSRLRARLFIYGTGVSFMVLAVSVFVAPSRLQAQQSAAASELSNVLRDSDYALRRFEEVTSRINFNTWQDGTEANSAQRMLRTALAAAAEGRHEVADWQSQGRISVSTLFEIYDDLDDAERASYSLSSGTRRNPEDNHLAIELIETSTLLVKTERNLRPYVVQSIKDLEVRLGSCNQNRK